MPCLYPHSPKIFSIRSRLRHPDWWPRLTTYHRCRRRCMLAHRHQNWNHQHWSHVLFADECLVSLYNSHGHVRVFHHVVHGIREHRVVEADLGLIMEYLMRPALMVTLLGPFHQLNVSVWGISLGVLSDIQLLLNVHGPCGQRQSVQCARQALPWYGEGLGLLWMWSSSLDAHVAPG